MSNNSEYRTFLYVDSNNLIIIVLDSKNQTIYKKEALIKNTISDFYYEYLNNFLSQNVFEIEKILKEFVNNIFLIIDHEKLNQIKLSIKDKSDNASWSINSINNLLSEAKSQCKKTLEGNDIIHMKIDQFYIDEISYTNLPLEKDCKIFSIDLSFICLPNQITSNFEKIFSNYQISISKILSYQYLKEFLSEKDEDIFIVAQNIINGLNENEVFLTNKSQKNQGFFEKFFNFFN